MGKKWYAVILAIVLSMGCSQKDTDPAVEEPAAAPAPVEESAPAAEATEAVEPEDSAEPTEKAADNSAPLPAMPANWTMEVNSLLGDDLVKDISAALGGECLSIRNTIFKVDGKTVQVNSLIAKDEANAAKVMTALKEMKIEEAMLQQGTLIYEFVGTDDVLPLIKAGRAHLAGE